MTNQQILVKALPSLTCSARGSTSSHRSLEKSLNSSNFCNTDFSFSLVPHPSCISSSG